jgi:hypothetical protein
VPGSQVGVAPAHCALVTHPTQVPAAVLQTGVAPEHRAVFVAEQAPHAPLDWHAGVAPPQSASATQPWQVCVVPSQAGAVPPHWAAVRHPTHVAVAGLHTGVAPAHWLALLAEQLPQAPLA